MNYSRTKLPLLLLLVILIAAILAWKTAATREWNLEQLSRNSSEYRAAWADWNTFKKSAEVAHNEAIAKQKLARLMAVYNDMRHQRNSLEFCSEATELLFFVIAACVASGLLGLSIATYRCFQVQSDRSADWQTS